MTWTKKSSSGGATTVTNNSGLNQLGTSTKKPMIYFIFDDTCRYYLDNVNIFTSRGAKFTTGLRQDFIFPTSSAGSTTQVTWNDVKALQDAGIEIAYHGMHHNYTGEAQYTSENDVPTYLNNTTTNNININGWIGPNGDYFQDLVFGTYFNTFKWARGGTGNGVATGATLIGQDYFKLINGSFIDDLTSETALTTLKPVVDNLASRGTGCINLSMHWSPSQTTYLTELLDYIISKNISIVTVSEAYATYGAVMEYYDSGFSFGSSLVQRQNGNSSSAYTLSTPHFVMQKDGSIISNMPVKMVNPKKGNVTYTGNSLPDDFDFGISIIQYGSTDSTTGFPNVGDLYNFNFGRNAGDQFQLYKAYNSGGIYFREANTNNTWKSSTFDKLGIFRNTIPANSTSAGAKGDWAANANYLYVCYADNNWIRIPKDTITW